MIEQWKPIKEYSNYLISNYGNVKTKEHIRFDSLGRKTIVKEKAKKPSKDKDGYLIVSLSKNKKSKAFRIHRLVAEAFIQNPFKLPQVNHKNEIKDDNRVDNLEWCDNKYNSNYGNRTRLINKSRCKFIIIQKDLKGNVIKVWDDIYELSHTYNYQTIRDAIRKNIKPKKYIWERVNI